ncbi:MAG: C4-type zinc ribbon domain-containing protein [Acidobacteria bacterium]|nr:C4-type zinc ribbon domain-containing protein [Acidobacteriota bacterium]MCA1643380.1 C4-type zinc ribbon domain-containing protein [Acidobacteriota bacterium]
MKQLIALQNADTCIRKLKADLDAVPERRAEIDKEFDQRAFEFKTAEAQRDAARERRASLEAELAETRAKAEHSDRALMASTNEKEYTAAIREADAARKHASQLETQILEQMEAVETAEKRMAELEPEVAKLRAERDEQLAAFELSVEREAERVDECRREREQLLAELPKPMGALFNRISSRIRNGVAVAEAKNGACTACFMSLRPQVMADIRRGDEIIICDNCNRILYYAGSAAAAEQAQTIS